MLVKNVREDVESLPLTRQILRPNLINRRQRTNWLRNFSISKKRNKNKLTSIKEHRNARKW